MVPGHVPGQDGLDFVAGEPVQVDVELGRTLQSPARLCKPLCGLDGRGHPLIPESLSSRGCGWMAQPVHHERGHGCERQAEQDAGDDEHQAQQFGHGCDDGPGDRRDDDGGQGQAPGGVAEVHSHITVQLDRETLWQGMQVETLQFNTRNGNAQSGRLAPGRR